MCGCNDCNGLPQEGCSDGVGIVSTIDNNNGTFTFIYSDGSTFTTSDLTGPQGATGPTGATGPQGPAGNNGSNANIIVEEGAGIDVTSSIISGVKHYNVASTYLETFTAALVINNTYAPISGIIPLKSPSTVSGIINGQIITKYNFVNANNVNVAAPAVAGGYVINANLPACSFGTFNNDTGIFTITSPGTYLMKGIIHLKSDTSSSAYWQSANIGSFGLGLITATTDIFSGQYQATIANINKHIDIEVSNISYHNTNTSVRLSALNLTSRNYNGTGYSYADIIRFSIIKLK